MLSQNPTPLSACDFAGAMLSAARKLGLEGTFLRMVAAELPDAPWCPTVTLSENGDSNVLVTAAHCCVLDCPATAAHCRTALKIEEVVSKQMGYPYSIGSLSLEGETLRLSLHPFA